MTRRLPELDALRGIAALTVLTTHLITTATSDGFHIGRDHFFHRLLIDPRLWLELPPLRVLIAGHAAVAVFFVLSGFVLALPILNDRQPNYPNFLIKRFFRIYIPFALAILLAAAVCATLSPKIIAGLNSWFNMFWHDPVTLQYVLDHLSMSGKQIFLDAPMWSLIHEVRISIIFPPLALITIRWPRRTILCSFLLTCLIVGSDPTRLLHGVPGENTPRIVDSLKDSASIAIYFILGISVAANVETAKSILGSMSATGTAIVWAVAILLLEVPLRVPLCDVIIFPIGAVLLVGLCVSSPRAKLILNHPFFYWLGRISFSLYLIHFIVVLTVVHLLQNKLPLWLILSALVPMCLLAAEIMHRLVEFPSQSLGKRLTSGQRY